MALHSVLLPMILAVPLVTTECCVSSPRSRMDLHLHSQKNASGHWIIRVNAQRSLMTENEREIIIDVQQQTSLAANNELEQVVSMTTVYPPLHDTSMPGAIEPATTTTTTATSPTATTSISTNTPKSCPHSGYQLYPGYNCYKAFPSERKTWSEARQQCIRDGGDLMVIDSEQEREDVYLYYSVDWYYRFAWVGVYVPPASNNWTTVKGQPVPSTWWYPGYPDERAGDTCAAADRTGLLWNWGCPDTRPFICEISL